MGSTATRERILTDNEKFGNGVLDEAGGVWVVLSKSTTGQTSTLCHLFSTRQAAEDYIHDKCEEKQWPLHRYALQLWAISETWPDEKED